MFVRERRVGERKEKGRTKGRKKNRQIREKTNSREERLGIKEQGEVKGESGGDEWGGKRGEYREKLEGNKQGRRGVESGEERITRDERNREERIIVGRDERAESKTASEIEMGRERQTERC